MQTTISKWGNSLGLRLPRHFAEATRLVEGTTVKLELEDGGIRITPARQRLRLADLLEGESARRTEEFDWGSRQGEEEW